MGEPRRRGEYDRDLATSRLVESVLAARSHRTHTGSHSPVTIAAVPVCAAATVVFLHADVRHFALNNERRINVYSQHGAAGSRTRVETRLVAPEPGVVELLDGVLHVLVAQELDDAGAVLEGVGEADVARLAHVVLEVLPGAGGRQARDQHAVLGAARGRPARVVARAEALPAAAPPARAPAAAAARELHAQPVPVVVVPVASADSVVGVPARMKSAFNLLSPLPSCSL